MHALRCQPRRLRRFTWVALVSWVFAVALASANACLAAADESPHADAHSHSREHPHESTHEGTREATHEPGDTSKAGCLKFCDDESSALSKSGVSGTGLLPAGALLDGFEIPPAPETPGLDRLSRAQPRSQGPPLVIRLLRLTL